MNTAPIDASQVYGSTERVAEELRETEPGMFACVHRLRTVHRCKMSDLPKVHHVSKLNNKQLLGFGFCDMHNNQCYQRQQLSLAKSKTTRVINSMHIQCCKSEMSKNAKNVQSGLICIMESSLFAQNNRFSSR